MSDVNANISIGIDTSNALAELKSLQRQISLFYTNIAKSSATASLATRDLQKNLINDINATNQFSASLRKIQTSAETFNSSLEKNKFSTREYFRYAGGATKTFGRLFRSEFDTIEKVAKEKVKTLQTQYIKLGRDANGAMQAIAIKPLVLDMENLSTKTAVAAQKQALFNQLMKQGSTNLLNFGKNTQWAGRQLMVGFTIPLTMLGSVAAKTFMDIEKQAISFKKVYGDLFTTPIQTQAALKDIQTLGLIFTKYGVALSDTMAVASEAAAAGFKGAALMRQTREATRLAVLGQIDQSQALKTTIALQNAFGISTEELSAKINFLNSVENQTVTSLDDITQAIPRVAPVIKQLGGDVEDLTYFITAMKEGGINAAEGANALKSGLSSLINPSKAATEMFSQLGINLKTIVVDNRGDLSKTIDAFARSLDKLDPLNRAQALETLFGKFQVARVSALFANITKEGSQASRVLDLAGMSIEDLANTASSEFGVIEKSASTKFKSAMENLKVSIAPVGEQFLKTATPIVEFLSKIAEGFNNLSDRSKKIITILVATVGAIGPVLLMTFGLLANGLANIIKLFIVLREGFLRLTGQSNNLAQQTQFLTEEQAQAAAIAHSLDQSHAKLTQTFNVESASLEALRNAYTRANQAAVSFAATNPNMVGPNLVPRQTKKYANGVVGVPGPKGAGDIIPAMLSPGESIIPAAMTRKYAPLIQGMVSDNIPGFVRGVVNLGMPRTFAKTQSARLQEKRLEENFARSSFAGKPPTDFGHLMKPFTGHSFPIKGVGGVYRKPDGSIVVVKPVTDELSGIAEINSNTISRDDFDLVTPKQKMSSMIDPTDPTGQRKILVLESPYDSAFATLPGTFTRDQYIKQLVASSLRGDKDLSPSNLGGNIQVDAGASGIYSSASGFRELATTMPSMAEQAAINVLGVKGSYARRFFAEATQPIAASLSPQEFESLVLNEIRSAIPKLKKTISSFKLSGQDVLPYEAMLARLEAGQSADWQSILEMHKKVVPGFSNGVFSVPGPKGAGDVVPAMLSPGESVISTAMTKKYGGLINSIIADNVPGYRRSLNAEDAEFSQSIASAAPQKSQAGVQTFLEREFRAIPETLIEEFKSLVTTVSQELNLSEKALKERLKSFRAQYNANIGQQEELQFAHLDTGRRVNAGDLQSSGAIVDPKTQARLSTFIDAAGRNAPVDLKTGFGLELTGFLNNAMQGSGASLEDVIADSKIGGVDKFRKSIEMGGGNMIDLGPELATFDARFQQNLEQAYSQGATIIVDSQEQIEQMRQQALVKGESFDDEIYVAMDTVAEQTRQNVLQLGSGLDAVFEEAKNRITEIRFQGLTPEQNAGLPAGFSRGSKGGRITPGSTSYGRGSIVVGSFANAPIAQQSVANVDAAILANAQAAATEQIEENTARNRLLESKTTIATSAQDQLNKTQTDLNNALRILTSSTKMTVGSMNKAIAVRDAQVALGMIQPATPPRPAPGFLLGPNGLPLPKGPLPKITMQGAKLLSDGIEMVPGSGNKDTVPAMLTPGEAVIPKTMAQRYAPLIAGMISGKIPGYGKGKLSVPTTTNQNQSSGIAAVGGGYYVPSGSQPSTPPLMQSERLKDAQAAYQARMALNGLSESVDKSSTGLKGHSDTVTTSKKDLGSYNSKFMGATFAIMSLGQVAGMFGGKMAEFSQTVSYAATALFAFSSITQLVSKQKALDLVSGRAKIAKEAMLSAAAGKGALAGSGRMASLGRLGLGLTKFVGPLALTAIALTAGTILYRKYQASQEKARESIEGLANAAGNSKEALDAYQNLFDVVVSKTPTERLGRETMRQDQRTQVDKLRESKEFLKANKASTDAMRTANTKDLTAVVNAKGMDLLGKGLAPEQVMIAIKALLEESGRSGFKFDYTKFGTNRDKDGQPILTNMKKTNKDTADFAKTVTKQFDPNKNPYANNPVRYGKYQNKEQYDAESAAIAKLASDSSVGQTDKFKKDMLTLTSVVSTQMQAIGGLLQNGNINIAQYNESWNGLIGTVEKMPEPLALYSLNQIIKRLPEEAQGFIGTLGNIQDKTIMIQMATLGMTDELVNYASVLAAVEKSAKDPKGLDRGLIALARDRAVAASAGQIEAGKKKLENYAKEMKKITDAYKNLGKESYSFLKVLQDEEKSMGTKINSYKKLLKAGLDLKTAQQWLNDPRNAKEFLDAKKPEQYIALMEKIKKEVEEFDKLQEAAGSLHDVTKDELTLRKAGLDYSQFVYEQQFEKEKEKMSLQSQQNEIALQQISEQEDAINKKYDKELESIDKVEKAQSKLNDLDNARSSFAQALISGDMSGAASAMQNIRQLQIAQSLEKQKLALEERRKSELGSVRSVSGQTKLDIENQNKLNDLTEKQIALKIEMHKRDNTNLNMTSAEIDRMLTGLDLAKNAKIDTNNPTFISKLFSAITTDVKTLDGTVGEMWKNIETHVKEIQKLRLQLGLTNNTLSSDIVVSNKIDQIAADTGMSASALKALGPVSGYVTPYLKSAPTAPEQSDTYKKLKALGLFSSGGRASGKVNGPGTSTSDSIPALLSDGEYVVNAGSVNKYGVGLFESLNAQKLADGGYLGVKGLQPNGTFEKSIGQKVVGAAGKATGAVGNFLKEGLQTMATSFIRPVAQGLAPGVEGLVNGIAGMGGAKPNLKFGDVNVAGANLYKKEGYDAKDLRSDILGIGLTVAPYGKILKPLLKVPGVAKTISTIAKPVKAMGSAIAAPFKNKPKPEITFDSALPTDILKAAIQATPRINWIQNNKNKTMLNNFEEFYKHTAPLEDVYLTQPTMRSNILGANEINFLNDLTASGMIQNGIPTFLSALTGKRSAKKIIDNRTNLYKQSLKDSEEPLNYVSPLPPWLRVDPEQITNIHSTKQPVVRGKNGDIEMYPGGNYYDTARSSFHTTLEGVVKSHVFNNWGAEQTKIVSSLGSLIKSNGKPRSANPIDTWWNRNPGQPLIYKNASIVRPFTDEGLYEEELIKRGLIEKGKKVPPLVIDKKTKEVLHISKKDYTAVDRLLIGRMLYPEGRRATGKSISSSLGRETSDLDNLAMQSAKELIGIKTPLQFVGDHSLTNDTANKMITQFAKENNIPQLVHSGTRESNAEKIRNLIRNHPGNEGPSLINPIETNMFLALRGRAANSPYLQEPEMPSVFSGLRKIFEPKNTVYAATRGMKLPPVAKKTQAEIDKIDLAKIAKENEGMRQEFSREWELAQIAKKEAAMASGTIDWAAISASLPKVAKKAGKKPAAEIEMKPKKNKTTKPSYYLYQGADDDISLYHNIFSAGAKSEEGTIKGVAAILHDPFDGSLLETIGNKGSITESFDLMALALMDAARMSGTTKTGLNAGIVSSRTDYSQKLVDTLKARGLDKIVDIHPRIKPSFVDETGKKTPPGSKLGGEVWLENELRFLNNESKRYDVLKSSTPIPDSVVKIAKQTLLDLLKYGFDKKQIDDAVKQYGKGMNIPGYAMGGIVAKYMASGGMASGTDTVPAMLTPGEFVVNRKATQAFGPLLSAINSPTFSLPNRMSSSLKSTGSGSKTAVNNSKTLYNYSVNVNVSNSGANPNDIARSVINQIKQIDNQRLRSF
jgi:TP901 family phage tail tape measure protein